jgi:hypothetical protein
MGDDAGQPSHISVVPVSQEAQPHPKSKCANMGTEETTRSAVLRRSSRNKRRSVRH